MMNEKKALKQISEATSITFLTGAGVSVPSGIPDYRSLKGIYQGINQPEYLLSRTCMEQEPAVFYQFVKRLYHPDATPNLVHQKMAQLAKSKDVKVVTQNIDGLHQPNEQLEVVAFHGQLSDCYCCKCMLSVSWQNYLLSDRHPGCGGQIRPGIVLYEEALNSAVIESAVEAVANAQLIVIVGTTFQVHPFCDLLAERQLGSQVIVVNQEKIYLDTPHTMVETDACDFFKNIEC